MGLWSRLFRRGSSAPAPPSSSAAPAAGPSSAPQAAGTVGTITNSAQLEEFMRAGTVSEAGTAVTSETALRIAAVFASVRIVSGAVANLPLAIKQRVDARTREDASDHPLWRLLRRRPNRWQTPVQFKRMLQAHVLLRGNAFALIVTSGRRVMELVPLHPDRVEVKQADDLSLQYRWHRKDGRIVDFRQDQIMHLVGLTLDGINGVSVIRYAREAIGLSLATEQHGARMFRDGARVSGVFKHPRTLGPEGVQNLKNSLQEFRAGGAEEGQDLVLEEGMDYERMSLTAEDAQWIESRKFSRSDIGMFFGVPPHMLGDTERQTSYGTGVEQQSIGFATYTLEDHLTMWEETINRDLLPADSDIYARFNRAGLVKADIEKRWNAHVKALQWGVVSPNEVREIEDMNPRPDGDIYYPPPNTAGDQSSSQEDGS